MQLLTFWYFVKVKKCVCLDLKRIFKQNGLKKKTFVLIYMKPS